MRVGLLQADWVNADLRIRFGDLADMVGGFLGGDGEAVEIDVFRILDGQLPADDYRCDLLLVPGSRFSAYEDFPGRAGLLDTIRSAAARGDRLLGLCFGAQAIAVALGGAVERSEFGWNVGRKPVGLAPHPAWARPARPAIDALFNHRDRIVSLPPSLAIIASAPACPISGFAGGSVLGFQFHPEYETDYQEALMGLASGLPPAWREDALDRNRRLADSRPYVRDTVRRFVAGERAAR